MLPQSPLTGGPVTLLKSVSSQYLSSIYRSKLNFDLDPFLDAKEIQLFRCNDTAYEFFTPGEVAGSPAFYEALYREAAWAYQETKWEYDAAARLVKSNDSVLDVGSGGGNFLASISSRIRVGLETNREGREATPANIDVLDESVEKHAKSRPEFYDVVTAIQVLEHIFDVRPFLEACRTLLRPGGVLVLSVPNNDGFVGGQELPLNMPPHHMGRWTRQSLAAIAPLLNLELLLLEFEPLQESNVDWYKIWMEREYMPRSRIARSLYYRLGFARGVERWLQENRHSIMGHTVLAAFRKPENVVGQ